MLPSKTSSGSSLGPSSRPSRRRYRQVDVDESDGSSDNDQVEEDDIEQQRPPRVPRRSAAPASSTSNASIDGVTGASAEVPPSTHTANELPIAEEVSILTTDEASKVIMAKILPQPVEERSSHPSRDSMPTSVATSLPIANDRFVNLKTLDDRTVRVPLPPEPFTLRMFRQEVERATGVPPLQQRLIINGRLLCIEDDVLQLEHGAYLHLAPLNEPARRHRNGSDDSASTDDEAELEYMPENMVQRQLGQLHALAWFTLAIFTLYSWRAMMNLAFDDDPEHNTTEFNVFKFFMGIYGIFVGNFGIVLVSRSRALTSRAGGVTTLSNVAETRGKVKQYILFLSVLALMYLMSMLQTVQLDKNTFVGVFLIQATFWYCILQAQVTHRALRESERNPGGGTHSTTPAAGSATVINATGATTINAPNVVITVPTASGQSTEGTEMTMFSSSSSPSVNHPSPVQATSSVQGVSSAAGGGSNPEQTRGLAII